MKNKLLLTSALISGLSVIGSAALAETKITGGLTTGYKSGDAIGVGKSSRSGFFRESQINFLNSGDLNNGFKYRAGFSFEADGGDTAGAGGKSIVTSDEGVFIEFIKGDSTLHFGMDSVQNIDQSPTPRVAENANTALGAYAGSVFSQGLNTPKGNFGIAGVQKTPYGTVSVNIVPSITDTGSSDNVLNVNAAADGDDGNSAYEVVYRGKPIANLDVMLARTVEKSGSVNTATGLQEDEVTTVAAFGYNFGKFAIGYDRRQVDAIAYDSGFVDQDQYEISATAAVSDNVTVGIGKIEVDRDKKALDEEIKYVQIGYNMGPIFTSLGYFDVENGGFDTANDGSLYTIRFGAKF